jgi:hypothetical protein|tara:strand:+ start:115 stop:354 length:240 start_codon:yes stop_codon:yes gene_type:complete
MRISSIGYGRTATIRSTMQDRPITGVNKTEILSVMELQEMTRKDSSYTSAFNKIPKATQKSDIDFDQLLNAILESGDLK